MAHWEYTDCVISCNQHPWMNRARSAQVSLKWVNANHEKYVCSTAKQARRHWLGVLGRVLLNTFLVFLLLLTFRLCWFLLVPPFGNMTVAKILLIGTDDPQAKGDFGRSDTIMLCAARRDGAGTTLLSIPRDARVRIPRHRGYRKLMPRLLMDSKVCSTRRWRSRCCSMTHCPTISLPTRCPPKSD